MLSLITGVPGSGKTLKLISDLMTRDDLKNRPLFLDGIPDVDEKIIPHMPIPEGESMQTWHKWAPTGAILVIDECQRVFRPRPSGSKVPDFVAELETHRHRGLDFFLLTQHPRLIDANVRSLIGHHTHISKTNLGIRRKVEWQRCANPEARSDVSEGIVSVYKLDKRAFGVYKSAEEHTKIKTKRSKVIYVLPMILAVIISALIFFYGWFQDMGKPIEQPQIEAQASSPEAVGGTVGAPAPNGTANAQGQYAQAETTAMPPEPPKPHLSQEDYKPRIDGQPHTAPIYDNLNRQVKTMPFPVACVKNANRCTCYTEQGTPIKEMKKSQCLDYVENGIYNPYKQQQTVQNQAPAVEYTPEQLAQVAVMGGQSPQNLMYDGYNEKAFTNHGAKIGL